MAKVLLVEDHEEIWDIGSCRPPRRAGRPSRIWSRTRPAATPARRRHQARDSRLLRTGDPIVLRTRMRVGRRKELIEPC